MDGFSLPVRELRGLDSAAVESLDLSRKKLRDASAIVIAACLRGNSCLTSLNVAANPGIGDGGFRAMGTALVESTASKLGALKCDAFELRQRATNRRASAGRGSSGHGHS